MPDPGRVVFVYHSHDGKLPNDKAVRLQIQKQAMLKAGLVRKQRGGYGQHNLRQYPIFLPRETSDLFKGDEHDTPPAHAAYRLSSRNGPGSGKSDENDPPAAQQAYQSHMPANLPCKMPPSPYEKFRCDLNFDITWLSLLTTSYFGRKAARLLASNPARFKGMLIPNQWSYLNFVPTRYEGSPLLKDVLFCIAAQSGLLLQPRPTCSEAAILRAYGNALQRLQKALTDPNGHLDPDVLCVTEVLALFELLKFSRGDRWQLHVIGASQIVSKVQVQILSMTLHALVNPNLGRPSEGVLVRII